MSLRIWLPLTKDLRNQGLSDVTVTNNGAAFNSAGKLGGCYNFTTSSYQKIGFPYSLANYTEFTVCVWVKPVSTTITGCLFTFINPNDYWQFVITNGNSVGIRDNSSGETGSRKDYTLGSFVANVWTHLAISYNKGIVKIYKDGVLFSTNNTGGSAMNNYSGTNAAIGESVTSSSSYYFAGSVNDFRIYDHCLSPMEVKQLSKGLVLHYPLNRQGLGQENLMPNSIEMPVGSANPSTGTWRLAGSSQMTRSRVAISDAPSGASTYGFQSVGLQTGRDASCWGIDGFPRENGTTYTLSAWGRIVGGSSTAAMLGFSVYSGTTLDYGGTYGKAVSSDAKYYGSGAYDYAGGQLNPNGNWTRIYRTFTSTSTSDNIYIGFNTAKTGSNVTLQLCGVKLEKGDKMTPWVPNSNESMYTTLGLNGTIEHDCSGFCNNGTRTGTFNWISDTPKYQVSTSFNGSNYIGLTPPDSEIQTVAFWVKWSSIPSTQTIGFIDEGSGLAFGLSYGNIIVSCQVAGAASCYNASVLSANNWYHIVVVKTGATTRKLYINAVEQTANSTTNYWSYINNELQIGKRKNTGEGITGWMSDFRMYATALSADDVKSLYQNSAYIDSSGNVYGAVHSEV